VATHQLARSSKESNFSTKLPEGKYFIRVYTKMFDEKLIE